MLVFMTLSGAQSGLENAVGGRSHERTVGFGVYELRIDGSRQVARRFGADRLWIGWDRRTARGLGTLDANSMTQIAATARRIG